MRSQRLNSIGHHSCCRTGFTLIELLVTIAIIAVLIALMLPAVQQSREAARRAQCRNNLTQIGLALHNYMMAHEVLPPGTQNDSGPIRSMEGGGYHMGWLTQILPYLEKQNEYRHIDFTKSVYDKINDPVRYHNFRAWRCASDIGSGAITNYFGIHNDFETPIDVDQNGVLFLNSAIRSDDIRDGSANTIFVTESKTTAGSSLGWMSGTRSSLRNLVVAVPNAAGASTNAGSQHTYRMHEPDLSTGTTVMPPKVPTIIDGVEIVGGPTSIHTGGFQVLLGDGSVRFISESIYPKLLRNLAHRSDGEILGEF